MSKYTRVCMCVYMYVTCTHVYNGCVYVTCTHVYGCVYVTCTHVCVCGCVCHMYRFILRDTDEVQHLLTQRRQELDAARHLLSLKSDVTTKSHLPAIKYPSLSGAVDYKLCPGDKNLLACTHDKDLWILNSTTGSSYQLTHCASEYCHDNYIILFAHMFVLGDYPDRKVSAGQSSFILQVM